jgi:Protein of unknown function (DUF3224)
MPILNATGWISVTSYDPKPYDGGDGRARFDVRVTEEFTGSLVGTGRARLLMVELEDGSSHFTGLEQFIGTLDGQAGSFLMRNSGVLKDGFVTSEWLVIPGSATGSLFGLSGTGGTGASGYFIDYSYPGGHDRAGP